MRGSGQREYRPRQAQRLCDERSRCSRNALCISPEVWDQVEVLLGLHWSPEQIASQLPISHETVYQKLYADKEQGGYLWCALRCQKKRRKRYASGHYRRGQIPDRCSITE
jgi:IS30 family transposase